MEFQTVVEPEIIGIIFAHSSALVPTLEVRADLKEQQK